MTTRAKQPTGMELYTEEEDEAFFLASSNVFFFFGGVFGSTISCHPQKEQ